MIVTQILEDSKANRALVVEKLLQGGCVALPTETVYGLAANGEEDTSVAKIYTLKGRPHFNPLILHGESLEAFSKHIVVNPTLEKLVDLYWPGPLTIVVKKKSATDFALASAGLETIAIRSPQNIMFRDILKQIPFVLAAPSANPSNFLSATSAADVARGFQGAYLEQEQVEKLYILDGGPCHHGVESTIVDATLDAGVRILRPGPISAEHLQKQGFPILHDDRSGKIMAPGQLARHYAPQFPLEIQCSAPQPHQAWIGFGPQSFTHTNLTFNLSQKGSLEEAAANLFHILHKLNEAYLNPHCQFDSVAVDIIPETGIGLAILDRLKRASAQ